MKEIPFDPKVGRIDCEMGLKKGVHFDYIQWGIDGQPIHARRPAFGRNRLCSPDRL